MKDTQLCHLSLGYSSSYKPNLFGCDSSNCFNTNIIITENTGRVLSCDHAYHNICFSQNRFKCLHCLDYIKSGVDEHVHSLLNRLRWLNSNNEVEHEEPDIPEDDHNDQESVDNMSDSWNTAI